MMKNKSELISVELLYDKDNLYKLTLIPTYKETDKHGNVDTLSLEGINLFLKNEPTIITCDPYIADDTMSNVCVDLGFGNIRVPKLSIKTKRTHTAVKEMTIDEIEKKLGYKIKIVNKGEI